MSGNKKTPEELEEKKEKVQKYLKCGFKHPNPEEMKSFLARFNKQVPSDIGQAMYVGFALKEYGFSVVHRPGKSDKMEAKKLRKILDEMKLAALPRVNVDFWNNNMSATQQWAFLYHTLKGWGLKAIKVSDVTDDHDIAVTWGTNDTANDTEKTATTNNNSQNKKIAQGKVQMPIAHRKKLSNIKHKNIRRERNIIIDQCGREGKHPNVVLSEKGRFKPSESKSHYRKGD